ncbi:uncharacterized protein DEA37_0003600, partial [Paragonimus westermani]
VSPFPQTSMGRQVISVDLCIRFAHLNSDLSTSSPAAPLRLRVFTAHLESSRDGADYRKAQLRQVVYNMLCVCNPSRDWTLTRCDGLRISMTYWAELDDVLTKSTEPLMPDTPIGTGLTNQSPGPPGLRLEERRHLSPKKARFCTLPPIRCLAVQPSESKAFVENPNRSPDQFWASWQYPSPHRTVNIHTSNSLTQHRPSRSINRVTSPDAYSRVDRRKHAVADPSPLSF